LWVYCNNMGLAGRLLSCCCAFTLCLAASTGCGGGGGSSVVQPGVSGTDLNPAATASAIAQLNHYRRLGSLPIVTADTTLCLGAQHHANYMTLNQVQLAQIGLAAHDEVPGQPGYTALGDSAGHNSVIYQGVAPVEAIDNWTRTLYHRLGLFDPNLTRVGFGSYGGFQVLDIGQGRLYGSDADSAVVMFPFPGMQGIHGEYKREIPHPTPNDDEIGTPITVEFFGMRGRQISNVTAEVRNMNNGAKLGAYLQYPGKPFLKDWDLNQLIALIPSSPLPPQSTIQVTVQAQVDGYPFEAQWQFSTR
jgi:hypothetical protein